MKARSTAMVLVRDIVFDFVKFPVWWYSAGLASAGRFTGAEIRNWAQRLSLVILLRNLFKPMYGDYTRTGKAISFFLRLFMFAVKFVVMVVWTVVVVSLFVVWCVLPAGLLWLFIRALSG